MLPATDWSCIMSAAASAQLWAVGTRNAYANTPICSVVGTRRLKCIMSTVTSAEMWALGTWDAVGPCLQVLGMHLVRKASLGPNQHECAYMSYTHCEQDSTWFELLLADSSQVNYLHRWISACMLHLLLNQQGMPDMHNPVLAWTRRWPTTLCTAS